MIPSDRSMPVFLAYLHTLDFDIDATGMDYEPYDAFLSEEDTDKWIQAWTDNHIQEGKEFLVFGQDGTGGLVAFWCVRDTEDIAEQPIVFFDSEGDLGVVASNLADYLWLLAGGVGPYEAIHYGAEDAEELAGFTAFAQGCAPEAKKTAQEVLAAANLTFPSFAKDFEARCGIVEE